MRSRQLRLKAPEEAMPDLNEVLTLNEMEKKHIGRVIKMMDENYSEAAKKLGISRSTLWRNIKDYGLLKK